MTEFTVGDKVFAKVRGYPAWPALVEKITDGLPSKRRYHVCFFGTGETAVCKFESIYNYEENKEKFGKSVKRSGFIKAMAQIEGLSPTPEVEKTPTDNLGNFRSSVDGMRRGMKRKRDCKIDSGCDSVGSSISETPPLKRHKKNLQENSDIQNSNVSSKSNIITSRSGREIKIKKYCSDAFKVLIPKSKKIVVNGESPQTNLDSSTQNSNSSDINSKDLGRDINNTLPSCASSNDNINIVSEEHKLHWYKTEVKMLSIMKDIRKNLGLRERANATKTLHLLNDLGNQDLNMLMLKKHPTVLKDVRTLRRYVGNTSAWNLTPVEEEAFQSIAAKIRNKAVYLYGKFQDMVTVPDNYTFWDYFLEQVTVFQERTASLSIEERVALITDPTAIHENLNFTQSPTKEIIILCDPIDPDEEEENCLNPVSNKDILEVDSNLEFDKDDKLDIKHSNIETNEENMLALELEEEPTNNIKATDLLLSQEIDKNGNDVNKMESCVNDSEINNLEISKVIETDIEVETTEKKKFENQEDSYRKEPLPPSNAAVLEEENLTESLNQTD